MKTRDFITEQDYHWVLYSKSSGEALSKHDKESDADRWINMLSVPGSTGNIIKKKEKKPVKSGRDIIGEDIDIIKAKCELEHGDENVIGHFLFSQKPGQPTLLVGRVTGLEPGEHGFHIHQYGDLSNGCESAGPHFNPDGVDHGDATEGHVGDLGNITADENGVAEINLILRRVDLSGDRSVVGRAIVVHADEDDLGQGGDEESLKTGNAGDRVGCGVIRMSE